jgi:hypothetical protein
MTPQRRWGVHGRYKKRVIGIYLIMDICGNATDRFEFHQQFAHGGPDLRWFYCYMHDFIELLNVN